MRVVLGASNDFNCPNECGLYSSKDKIGPILHASCTAMDNKKCRNEFGGSIDYKLQEENEKAEENKNNFRIVGGKKYANALPWMVESTG